MSRAFGYCHELDALDPNTIAQAIGERINLYAKSPAA